MCIRDRKMTFFVRVFYIAQRCIGSIVCAIGKPCVHGSLDLFAGLAGVHLIQDCLLYTSWEEKTDTKIARKKLGNSFFRAAFLKEKVNTWLSLVKPKE